MKQDTLHTSRFELVSQSWMSDELSPTAMCLPSGAQLTLVMGPLSSSTVTSSEVDPLEASHRYTVSPRAMDSTLLLPQSSRLR